MCNEINNKGIVSVKNFSNWWEKGKQPNRKVARGYQQAVTEGETLSDE